MDTLRSDDLKHRQALEILPWYVRRQLGPEESRKMDAHLATCSACRREAAGLARMFNVQEQSIPDRAVDEKRLDALFARIEQYEAERPKARQRQAAAPSVWSRLSEMLTGWLPKPALLAGAAAAILAVIVAVPMLDRPASGEYEVLKGDWEPAFSVTFHLKTGQDAAQFEKMIDAARASGKLVGKYSIDRRSATEYRVVFAQKPGVDAMNELFAEWRNAPNVANVTIDTGPTH
jgi:hypothetical protein